MKLSEIPSTFALDVRREGSFGGLGFVSYTTPDLLVFLESEKYLEELCANPRVTSVITNADLVDRIPAAAGVAVSASPRKTFYLLHNHLARETSFYAKYGPTTIASSARVHPRAYVADTGVTIGERCLVEPNATILEGSVLEDDVIVRAGAVIGAEGFQVVDLEGKLVPVAHAGGVILGRGTQIQSTSCVDRSVFGGHTELGEETMLDNGAHVAHNGKLGKRNRLAAHAMLAGSVTTGDDVWFGPSCAIGDGLTIGTGASITIGAVVTRDVPAGGRVSGNFAIDHARFIAHMKAIR